MRPWVYLRIQMFTTRTTMNNQSMNRHVLPNKAAPQATALILRIIDSTTTAINQSTQILKDHPEAEEADRPTHD